MSDNVLKLIPTSVQCAADSVALKKAVNVLASFFPEAAEVGFESTEQVRFIDPGENLEKIFCPICSNEIDVEWWQEAMSTAHQRHFSDLSIELPCCGAASSLNDLIYHWPAGFARFVLTVRDPNAGVDRRQLESLEAIVGCTLREIWAHY